MKKLPLLALLLLLVGAGGLLFWISREGTSPAGADAPLGAAKVDGASDLASGITKLESDATPGAELESEKRTGAAAEVKAGSWDPAQSVWLSGTVRTTTVDDGPLEVFALSKEADSDTLAALIAPKKKTSEDSENARILARCPVGANGAFRLGFPPDTKLGHVSVFGRYHFLPKSQSFDLAKAHDVVLTPQCGACIAGSVVVPARFDANSADAKPEDVEDLEGLDVSLATSMEGMRGSVMTMDRIKRGALVHERAFEFRALPAEGGFEMTIEPKTLAAARITKKDLTAGRTTPVDLVLHRGGTVRGTVKDASGQPVAGAKVGAALPGRWFGFDNKTVREVTSSSEGAFELAAVTPGRVVMKATAEKYLDSEALKIDLADGGAANDVMIVLTQGKSVSGVLTWSDATPAAGLLVSLKFDMSQMYGMGAFGALRGAKGEAKSGADGSFEIGGLGDGPFTIEAEAPPRDSSGSTAADAPTAAASATLSDATASTADAKTDLKSSKPGDVAKNGKHDKSTLWRARVDGVAGGTNNVSLVLRAPEGLAGKVVDEAGAPIAKFRLDAGRIGKGPLATLGQEKRDASFDDAGGAFLLGGLQEGHWRITASSEGFAPSDPLEVDIPRKADAEPVVIALVHGASIKGIVRTPGGAPVADADILVDNGKPNWQNMLDSGSGAPKTKSQADGTFEIEGLKPGKTALYAKHKQFARSPSTSFDLAPAQHTDGAEILLREGGTLSGEVFGDSGAPSVGFMVQASETKIFDQQMTFSDGRGQFEIEHLEPGTWQVVAMPTGNDSSSADDAPAASDKSSGGSEDRQKGMMDMMSKMKTAMVDIKDGEKTHIVLGAPPADPVRVHGRVTHAGEPYAGSMLSFVGEGKGKLKAFKTTQVDKDGNYSIKLDEPGNYVVSVQRILGTGQQNAVEFASEIPKDKDYKLDFALPTARISGRVLGPDGDPAPGTRVSLHPESPITAGTMWGGQYSESAADGEGRFDVQALRPGKYTLMVGGMALGGLFGGDDGALGRQVKGDIHLSEGEWMKDVDFRLKKSGGIDVEVVDDAGSPVSEAALFARNKDGKLLDRFSMIATDSNGKCKYGGLEPGSYFLSARKGSVASPDSSQVRVEEGQRASAKLVLQAGTVLIVEVTDGENKAVKASLSVQDEDGREVGGMIALSEIMKMFSEGGFSGTEQRVGPLPPGKYRVRATITDGKTQTKPVTLSGQPERKLSIHIM